MCARWSGIREALAWMSVAERLRTSGERVERRQVRAHVMAFGNDALAHVDRDPTRIEEHAFAIFDDAAAAAEQFDLLCERIGHRHRPHIVPEARVGPLGGVIMEDQEVADAVIFHVDQAIEFIAVEG